MTNQDDANRNYPPGQGPVQPRPPVEGDYGDRAPDQPPNTLSQALAPKGAYPPPYNDEAPPPRPSDPPAQPRTIEGPFAHLDTAYLNRAQKELRNHIPSDPTFIAHVGVLLRSLIGYELRNPDRIAADVAQQEAATQAQREAQKAALPPDDPEARAALDLQHQRADLAIQQVQERAEFDAHQAEQRAALQPPDLQARPNPVPPL